MKKYKKRSICKDKFGFHTKESWNNSIGNTLLYIKNSEYDQEIPTIGENQSVVLNIRKEEVVLAHLRLGHTRVTHSYLLQGEEQPQCVGCDAPFTVRHFLFECADFAQVRNNCFHVDNMKELFQDKHIDPGVTLPPCRGLWGTLHIWGRY